MELRFPHHVEYKNAGAWPLEDAITSLQAQRKLLEEGVATLDSLLEGFQVSKVEIRVNNIASTNPLVTDLIILVYGQYQQQIEDKVIGQIETMFGTDIPEQYEPIVALATLAVTYMVARWAYDRVRSKGKTHPASTHITGSYNTVVNILADKLNLSEGQVTDALNEAVPPAKRRSLVKSVTNFFRPRKDGVTTPIQVKGAPEIGDDVLREYPTDVELLSLDDTRNIDIPRATLNIRAIDRDKTKTGWAAVIQGDRRFKKRLPMDLYPTVDAEQLSKMDQVIADVIVEGDRRADGTFAAKRIHLIAVHKSEDDNGKR